MNLLYALDLETHLIQPGLLAPPIVCASYAHDQDNGVVHRRFDPASFDMRAQSIWSHPNGYRIAGANIAYDVGCLLADQPELLPIIFKRYEQDGVHDVLIGTTLHLIAGGYVRDGIIIDPRNGGQIKSPSTGKMSRRVSLEIAVDIAFNDEGAKRNDEWRLRYAELENVRICDWPEAAKQYPVDDAINTFNVAKLQIETYRNQHDMGRQTRAALALHLASMWGLRTNANAVTKLADKIGAELAREGEFFIEKNLIDPESGKTNGPLLARMVAVAYGANEAVRCDPCEGIGKAPVGKNGNVVNCPECNTAGIKLPPNVPRTEGGKLSTSRDTLSESGDDLLERFAEISMWEKLNETYLPFVKQGTTLPINLPANVLLATGRASYDGLIQLLPRKGGVRECFEFRTVGCTVDYSALEFCTLAQAAFKILGRSKIRESINDGFDSHCLFGARLINISYDDFMARRKAKDKFVDGIRQASKAANFGFGGMMGPATFVIAKRKEGLRICQLVGRSEPCGLEKVTSWGRQEFSPTCKACIIEADKLRKAWLAMWPEMQDYFQHVLATLDGNDSEMDSLVSERTRGGLSASAGANYLFQALAADGAKDALWDVQRACYLDRASPLFGSRLVIFAHDELITELGPDPKTWHDAAYEQARLQIAAMQRVCPDVKITAEPALMKFWFKGAEAVFDSNNRLIPWEPKQ